MKDTQNEEKIGNNFMCKYEKCNKLNIKQNIDFEINK